MSDAEGVQVRLATDEDLPGGYALRHEVFVLSQDVPYDTERDHLDETCEHAVAVLDGAVVGAGRLIPPEALGRTDDVGTIGRMAVAAPVRGRGVGARLLRLLEDRAAERGCPAVELHAQVRVLGFYERAGYTAFGEPYDEAGIPHLSMRKQLTGQRTGAPPAAG